jgi:mercuric ion transport protein
MTVRDEITPAAAKAKLVLPRPPAGKTLLSIAGILAALASAACCVVPFGLFVAGVSGAWIGNLTALKPYQPLFVGFTVACLAGGYWGVYRKPKAADCAEGSYCAKPASDQIAKIGLWTAAFVVAVALGFPYLARCFFDT